MSPAQEVVLDPAQEPCENVHNSMRQGGNSFNVYFNSKTINSVAYISESTMVFKRCAIVRTVESLNFVRIVA